jgi:AAA+ ATPase superfamily predicted ATPase
MNIIGRDEEIRILNKYVQSDSPEFLVVYGRRRIGKTYLIREFFDGKFFFQYTGYVRVDDATQLARFSAALNKYGKSHSAIPKNWYEAFDSLIDLIEESKQPDKKVVFLDELPWMDAAKSDFLSAFEHFWNGWGAGRKDLLLIVCGSASAWIIKNIVNNTGGLHNRVTRQIYLRPFTLKECESYFERNNVILSRYQMLECYMIFGGIPYYLSLMDNSLSLAQNIDMLCFAQNAPLRNEYQNLYSSLFKNAENHIQVVNALTKKGVGLTRADIVGATKLNNGGYLTKVLSELELSDFIRSYKAFPKKTRDSIYQLIDFFTLFYVKFMEDNTDEHFWSTTLNSGVRRAWSGYSFELVCLSHINQIKKALGISGVNSDVSSWRSKTADPGAQIDLIIDRADHIINLCELKYSNTIFSIDKAYDKKLLTKRSAFAEETKTKKGLHQTMVTTYGISKNAYSGAIQSEVTMDALFE